MANSATNLRKNELAQIHIGRQQLGMDDATYRDMLWSVARVKSSADLDWSGRKRVLDHLKACGAKLGGKRPGKPSEWAFIDRAQDDRKPMLRKICVLARRAGVGKAYVEGIAKQMENGVTKPLEFCSYTELWRLVSALAKHLERQEKHKKGETNDGSN